MSYVLILFFLRAKAVLINVFYRTIGVPYQPVGVEIVSLVKKCLKLQDTQTGNPIDIRQMMRRVEKYHIVPEVELKKLDDVPGIIDALANA